MSESPTVGMCIRALRMGFGPAFEHGAFIRISGDGPFKIEVEPIHLIPNNLKSHKPHRVWWSKDSSVNLKSINALQHVTRVKRPFMFWINDDGLTIQITR